MPKRAWIPALAWLARVLVTIWIAVAVMPAAASDCTYDHTYIGNRPKEGNPGWHEETQGIGHDDAFWYIAQKGRLWKIPGTRDLAAGVSCNDVPCRALADTELGQLGFDHLGDLTHHQGYLCIGVEYPGKTRDAVLAVFRAADLSLVDYAPLSDLEGTSGWCAVDAAGYAYSSKANVTELSRYDVNWSTVEQGLSVLKVGTVFLRDESDAPLELFVMQGGVFSDDGLLYLINGDATTDCDGCGIHVFEVTLAGTDQPCTDGPGDCIARRVARSRNGSGPFNYQYNPGTVFNREEPEGITYWDLTAPGAPAAPGTTTGGLPVASSQLHALMLDNDLTTDDDIYVKHYRVEVTCAPEAGIRVLPGAVDFGDVDMGVTAARLITLANDGTGPLGVSGVAIEDDVSTSFALAGVPSLPFDVAPGEQVSFEARFTPAVEAVVTARLVIDSDDPDDPRVTIPLAGAGLSLATQAGNLVEQFDEAFREMELRGDGPGGSDDVRWKAMRNMLVRAQELIEAELFADACVQLEDALERTDGATPPPDLVTGPAAQDLAAEIADLLSHLPCGG